MIITRKKPYRQVLDSLKKCRSVFIIGCAQCATVCKTGGEEEVDDMQKRLAKEGIKVTGKAVLDPACHLLRIKQLLHKERQALNKADAILTLTCGDGTQAVKDGTKAGRVIPALDSMFLGEIEHSGHFSQKCILCGECIIDKTDAICPLTICTKGLLNGPCGGSKNGKCEVDRDRDCGWILIYKSLKESGNLDNMRKILKPLDYSKQLKPQRIDL